MDGRLNEPAERNETQNLKTPLKEMTMNTFVSILYRNLSCAAAATAITLVLAAGFVQSTAVPPGMHASTVAVLKVPAGEQA